MKCDICKGKEATIHIQEVVSNNIKSLHICEKCAKTYGFKNELIDIGFHLMDFLHNFKSSIDPKYKNNKINNNKKVIIEDENKIKCIQCNTTYDEFLETGKFGCAFCYIAFKEQIKPIIRRIHGKTTHKGDVPQKYKKQLKLINDIKVLNHRLKLAIKKEDFKTAAKIRDKIKKSKIIGGRRNVRI